jgi:membrane-anchored protein YejM (alkaline phosphatase superfamily)
MPHHHSGAHVHEHERQTHWTRKPHVKWTAIAIVALMIASMLIYVFSVDDSLVPGQPEQQRIPAAP